MLAIKNTSKPYQPFLDSLSCQEDLHSMQNEQSCKQAYCSSLSCAIMRKFLLPGVVSKEGDCQHSLYKEHQSQQYGIDSQACSAIPGCANQPTGCRTKGQQARAAKSKYKPAWSSASAHQDRDPCSIRTATSPKRLDIWLFGTRLPCN